MLMGFKKGMARALYVTGLTSGALKAKLKSIMATDACILLGHFVDAAIVAELYTQRGLCIGENIRG